MKKTVVSHFYNEAWLLPHWLKHHRQIFDHGIMIDYHSTDNSLAIIRELCPTWEIHTSRNNNFDAHNVDLEVMDYERPLEGWRVTLNTTEFLIGNYDRLDATIGNRQVFVPQYMFIDMERREEPYYLSSDLPLYKQRWWGYGPVNEVTMPGVFTKNQAYGSVPRAARSIHNYALPSYGDVGRHFPRENGTFDDLAIFYYGYASLEEGSIKRKMQIQTQITTPGTNHHFDFEQLMNRYKKEQQPLSRDMRDTIKPLIDAHENWVYSKNKPADLSEHKINIQSAIDTLNSTLSRLQ